MNKQNTDFLHKNFPKLYLSKVKDSKGKKTIRSLGFECGDGWFSIIEGLSMAIQNHIDFNHNNIERAKKWNDAIARGENPDQYYPDTVPELKQVPDRVEQVKVHQVKEKFGTLRFYYDGGDQTIDNYVQFAELMSAIMCEKCGKPGKTLHSGWITTMCPTCAKEKGLLFDDEREALDTLKQSIIHDATEAV